MRARPTRPNPTLRAPRVSAGASEQTAPRGQPGVKKTQSPPAGQRRPEVAHACFGLRVGCVRAGRVAPLTLPQTVPNRRRDESRRGKPGGSRHIRVQVPVIAQTALQRSIRGASTGLGKRNGGNETGTTKRGQQNGDNETGTGEISPLRSARLAADWRGGGTCRGSPGCRDNEPHSEHEARSFCRFGPRGR